MSFLNDIINALGLVDEEEVYEDELEQKEAKKKEEKKPFFKRKEKEAEALTVEEKPARKGLNFNFGRKKTEDKPEEKIVEAAPALETSKASPETAPAEEPAKKSVFNVFKKKENTEPKEVNREPLFKEKKRPERTINLPVDNKQVNVVIIEPVDFNDSPKIADYLRNGQPVVVNFDGVEPVLTKRMTDFISGTIYALNGSMKKLGRNILVCAPRNVDIDAGTEYEEKGEKPWKK